MDRTNPAMSPSITIGLHRNFSKYQNHDVPDIFPTVCQASFAGFSVNHWAMAGIFFSKSPGIEKFKTPDRFEVRFWKSCVIPPGANTKEPFGASIQRSPIKKLIVPSIT